MKHVTATVEEVAKEEEEEEEGLAYVKVIFIRESRLPLCRLLFRVTLRARSPRLLGRAELRRHGRAGRRQREVIKRPESSLSAPGEARCRRKHLNS